MTNIHTLFVNSDTSQFNENVNQANEIFHDQVKSKILDIEQDVIKFSKKVRFFNRKIEAIKNDRKAIIQLQATSTDLKKFKFDFFPLKNGRFLNIGVSSNFIDRLIFNFLQFTDSWEIIATFNKEPYANRASIDGALTFNKPVYSDVSLDSPIEFERGKLINVEVNDPNLKLVRLTTAVEGKVILYFLIEYDM